MHKDNSPFPVSCATAVEMESATHATRSVTDFMTAVIIAMSRIARVSLSFYLMSVLFSLVSPLRFLVDTFSASPSGLDCLSFCARFKTGDAALQVNL